MSKSRALAGLRVGYALGDVGLIEALRRVKDSFNSYPLGRVGQAGATASVQDDAHFRETCAKVVAGREAMTRELVRLGFVVLPSSANFVFARHPARGGAELAAALRERAVLVRHFNKPRTAPWLRITVGTDDDTRRLIAAAVDILGDG
jgi:histidinol-phosphate aminotransferase